MDNIHSPPSPITALEIIRGSFRIALIRQRHRIKTRYYSTDFFAAIQRQRCVVLLLEVSVAHSKPLSWHCALLTASVMDG